MCVPLLLRDRKGRWLLGVAVLCLVGLFVVVSPEPHYAAPALCVFYAVLVQALRHLRLLRFRGRRIGLGVARAAVVLLLFQTATAIPERLRHPFGLRSRAEVVNKLSHMPGKHLIIVRYGPAHNINFDWVYNDADIDGSKVVWARDMGAEQNAKLLAYYRDRQVWRLTVDRDTEQLLARGSRHRAVACLQSVRRREAGPDWSRATSKSLRVLIKIMDALQSLGWLDCARHFRRSDIAATKKEISATIPAAPPFRLRWQCDLQTPAETLCSLHKP